MQSNSKKLSLFILGLSAILCSGVLLSSFHDPEGPNVLVVIGMAAMLYALSLVVARFSSSTGVKKFLIPLVTQIVLAVGFYFLLK